GSETFIREIERYKSKRQFHIFKTLPRSLYLSFLKHSDLLIGNSSSGFIESSYFNIPVVNIGTRQLGRPGGNNIIHAGYTEKEIKKAIDKALTPAFRLKTRRAKSPYGSGNASAKIVKVLEKNFNLIGTDKLFFKSPPK
ncbi:MAG: UDP-N-acetylglucosamine 2-epimerase, partial [bacterium]|nr:UDP-N-acetylglucosamine 2-epimerase [bacterium]